jgi:hypothetical protein
MLVVAVGVQETPLAQAVQVVVVLEELRDRRMTVLTELSILVEEVAVLVMIHLLLLMVAQAALAS